MSVRSVFRNKFNKFYIYFVDDQVCGRIVIKFDTTWRVHIEKTPYSQIAIGDTV